MRKTIGGEVLSALQEVAQNATGYSKSFRSEGITGNVSIFLVSTAGSITVTQQVSNNNVDWYDPVNGAGSAVGAVAAALTVTTGKWVTFTPVVSRYTRFKIVEGNVAATVVSILYMCQEEAT